MITKETAAAIYSAYEQIDLAKNLLEEYPSADDNFRGLIEFYIAKKETELVEMHERARLEI